MTKLGYPLEVDPAEALLGQVWEAAGNVAFLREQLDSGDDALVRWYSEERDRLARFAKMSIDAGVAERQVRIAEREGELLGRVILAVLGDRRLSLTKKQLDVAPRVVRELISREVVDVDA